MHISNLKIFKNPYTINDDGFISFKDRKSYEMLCVCDFDRKKLQSCAYIHL